MNWRLNTRGSFSRLLPRPVNTVVADNGKDGPHRFAVRERSGTKYIQHGNPQPKNGRVIGHIFPRPVNTVVADNGKDGPHRFAVRERSGTKYIQHGNPQPKNGRVIGHIFDGRFVPLHEATASSGPDMLSYGAVAFAYSLSSDILSDLMDIYPIKDACTIMAIAMLRVIRPSITAERMTTHYRRTFVCHYYPGLALSANTICSFQQKIGQDGKRRREFYQKRASSVMEDHHIAIDGTLKQDSSTVNDLSAFSYKARTKGCWEVSVLYAYDIEEMEPVCAEVFPGNSIDAGSYAAFIRISYKARTKGCWEVSVLYAYDIEEMEPVCAEVFPGNSIDAGSYAAFIRNNDIRQGIIVSDKGFPPSQIKKELEERPALHFLTPIRRNDVRIVNNDMLSFEGVLSGIDDHVVYKKQQIQGGRYLYAYRSSRKAAAEEAAYLSRRKKQKDFQSAKYEKKQSTFGVIVFESDKDLDPRIAYMCYEDRWLLELVFKQYKSDECLDRTGMQGDFSLLGSEFINFVSTVLTSRMLRKARQAGLLEKMSYGQLLEDLSSAWRMVEGPEEASTDDKYWVHTLNYVFEELEALGLSKPTVKPAPKKRGRPRKDP